MDISTYIEKESIIIVFAVHQNQEREVNKMNKIEYAVQENSLTPLIVKK